MSGERLCDMRVWLTTQNQQLARMCCVYVWEGFVGIASKPILLEYVSYL